MLGAVHAGLADLPARLAALPSSAGVRIIGLTTSGRPIHAVEIGRRDAARTSVILAGLHALEWIGVEVALALLARLAADPPGDRRIVAVPVVNADGVAAVAADLAARRRRYRRWNANRVDLNRNWPTHFAARAHTGAAPRSEPEVAAVARALDAAHAAAPIDRAVSLHSIGRMILVPWGGRLRRPAAYAELRAAAEAIRRRMPEPYRIRQVSRWLPGARARGLEIDDLHARYGALAVLIECTMGGVVGRWRRADLTQPFRWYNPPEPGPAAAAIAAAIEPFIRGAP